LTATDHLLPALELKGISKKFGHVTALNEVDLIAHAGEILAIVGDNGAGKSTLIKVISGVYHQDEGDIFVNSQRVTLASPADARAAGIATVFQDLALVECLDVSTNMFIGQLPKKGIFVDRKRMDTESRRFLDELKVTVSNVHTQIGMLSGGQRQIIAIARAVRAGAHTILLDEPTAALGVRETQHAADIITNLRTAGNAVIVVSHDIEFVFAFADRIQVMRLGQVAGLRKTSETSREEIIALITGTKQEVS
jgi:ABC-type sugar transport system ATPase subunit